MLLILSQIVNMLPERCSLLVDFSFFCFSFVFRHFGESFSVAQDVLKALNKIWHKALIYKLSSFSSYFSLCKLLPISFQDFLQQLCQTAIIHLLNTSQMSLEKVLLYLNSFSRYLFLLATSMPIHSIVEGSTYHNSAFSQE